jgi:hypothetical protein
MRIVVRGLIIAFGALGMLGGLALVLTGEPAGLWLMATGAFFVVVPLIERGRYRSEASEHADAPVGPGGGETVDAPLEPRFQPTAEVFVDPTSGRRMRVLVDPKSGERRYVAEG